MALRVNGNWQTASTQVSTVRGPNGVVVPPRTVAYAMPATYFAATRAEIQSELEKCSGGEVIEFTGSSIGSDPGSTQSLSPTSGSNGGTPSSTWTQNVLIRPPLGTRAIINSTLQISCQGLTVAGFDIVGGGIRIRSTVLAITSPTTNAAYSGVWRCVDTRRTGNSFSIFGGWENFIVDCAIAKSDSDPLVASASDRLDIYGALTSSGQTQINKDYGSTIRPLIDSVWIAPRARRFDSDGNGGYTITPAHVDAIQIQADQAHIYSPRVINSVIIAGIASQMVMLSLTNPGTIVFRNNYFKQGANHPDFGGSNGIHLAAARKAIFIDNDFNKFDFTATPDNCVIAFKGNNVPGFYNSDMSPSERTEREQLFSISDATNQLGDNTTVNPIPTPPVLSEVWPECPSDVVLESV